MLTTVDFTNDTDDEAAQPKAAQPKTAQAKPAQAEPAPQPLTVSTVVPPDSFMVICECPQPTQLTQGRTMDNHIDPGNEITDEEVVGTYDTYEEAKAACKAYIPSQWSCDSYEYLKEINSCDQYYVFVKYLDDETATVYIRSKGAPPFQGDRALSVFAVVERHGSTQRLVDTQVYDSLITANKAAQAYLQSLSSGKATECNIMGRVLPYCGTVDVEGKQTTITVADLGVKYSTALNDMQEEYEGEFDDEDDALSVGSWGGELFWCSVISQVEVLLPNSQCVLQPRCQLASDVTRLDDRCPAGRRLLPSVWLRIRVSHSPQSHQLHHCIAHHHAAEKACAEACSRSQSQGREEGYKEEGKADENIVPCRPLVARLVRLLDVRSAHAKLTLPRTRMTHQLTQSLLALSIPPLSPPFSPLNRSR